MDACVQGQSYVLPEQSCYIQDQHQGSPSIKKQSLGNVPPRKGPSGPKPDSAKEGQLHSLNTQAGPARITKAGAATKQARGITKATKEVARRESCEAEVARLRSAEQEHDAALKAAKKANLNASTKLQQLQGANEELNVRIQQLEACLSDTSHEVKELQRDKKIAAIVCSKTEKKIEMLEADKKSLVVSHDDAQQKASQELSSTKIKLTEMQRDLEHANQLIERLNTEVSQKGHDLEEQKDRVAQLLRDNEETLAKYNDIDGEISKLGPSLEKPLAELTHSVKELLEQQATKDSVEDIAQRIGNIPSLLSDEHVDFNNLQVTLQSLNDFKAAVDQELRNALARIHEEEQKRRALSEVELGLRQEVMELKTGIQ
ncbi:hypothetical protein UCDDS831_g04818 [Diplodia seriata]|uniref:Uncharacterized protein n=1 Tax=Diplodia seriata TaxID=420778 RepID=A0A0G2ECX7_9PEZI|nr:hypothetical protein UCDDS831_g04818 [Diplodia seriata]